MNAMNDDARKTTDAIIRSVIQSGGTVQQASDAAFVTYSYARKIVERMRDNGHLMTYIGRPPKLTAEQKAQVLDMVLAGHRREDIAKQFGVGTTMVNNIAQMRHEKNMTIHRKAIIRADVEFARMGQRMGKIRDVFCGLTHDDIKKIVADIPEGCTVADWLRSIVVDVVEDMK